MVDRMPARLIDTTGATDGQALIYHASTKRYEPTTISSGGGGGSGTVKDRRWTAGSAETSIDEHNDDSLAAAWARVDGANAPLANVDWTEGGDVLSAYHSAADTGNAFHAMLRPLSGMGGSFATGDAIITCVTHYGPPSVQYQIGGLCVADGNTYGAGKQLLAELYADNTSAQTLTASLDQFTNFTTGGTATSLSPLRVGTFGAPNFMRLVYLGGSVWRFDRSGDGISWLKGSNVTYASFTPTHAGYFVRDPGSGTKFIVSFDFLRRVSGVT